MKVFSSVLCVLLASLAAVHGQEEDPGPSPTESAGCEPHGDHWHCEGPATSAPPPETSSAVEEEDPGPSPTESAGCEPHGDHWHCEGPATVSATTSPPAAPSGSVAPSGTQSEDPGPSPTESIGCEPHGDHWHCEGPAISETGAAAPGAAVGYAAGALGMAALFV